MSTSKKQLVPWLLYLLTLVSAFPLWTILGATAPRPGACSGIGFGCSLNGADLAAVLLLLVGVPHAAGLAVILGLRSLVAERFVGIPIAVAAVGVAIPWAFAVAILISLGY